MNKIRRDDNVMVMIGKDRGRTGVVRKIANSSAKADKYGRSQPPTLIVTGINVVKRHMKARGPQKPGGIVERESPISLSNVALVCASCTKPVRVGFRRQADGKKVRFCKRCDANLD